MRVDESFVAKDVEAKCGKCGETWHVIVAVSDGKVAKVQCKQCGGMHNYRALAKNRQTLSKNTKSAVALSAPAERQASGPRKTRPAVEHKPKACVPLVAANQNPIQDYSIQSLSFSVGDRINHKKFGLGVVEEIPERGKIRVCFATQRLLLVYGK